jgi:hypothetical protein
MQSTTYRGHHMPIAETRGEMPGGDKRTCDA